jgi:hypothetical protein
VPSWSVHVPMTPQEFIHKWRPSQLRERQASQEHFLDLCHLLGEPTPAEADSKGDSYCFDYGASKTGGEDGFADVWKKGYFGWEYKGKHKDLIAAYKQLKDYDDALQNPPLLIAMPVAKSPSHEQRPPRSRWGKFATRQACRIHPGKRRACQEGSSQRAWQTTRSDGLPHLPIWIPPVKRRPRQFGDWLARPSQQLEELPNPRTAGYMAGRGV